MFINTSTAVFVSSLQEINILLDYTHHLAAHSLQARGVIVISLHQVDPVVVLIPISTTVLLYTAFTIYV